MKNPPRSRFGRALLGAGAALAIALPLAACGSGDEGPSITTAEAPTDGTLKIGLRNDIGQAPDPDIYYAGNGLALTTNMYEGLLRYATGPEPTIEPALATEWTVNETNTVFTFTLRQGVTFHDGTPFTSSAVEASFNRRLAVGGGPAYMAAGVASFETPDDYTVIITLTEPNSAFLDQLASPYGPKMISPTGLAQHAGDDHAQTYLKTNSLGTGPYTLTVAMVNDRYQMKAYEGYWGEEPTFTTIDFPVYGDASSLQLAMNNGDISAILGAVPSSAQTRYADSGELDTYALTTSQVGVLYMNPNRDFMATAEARKAVFDAIDWQSVIDQVVPETNVIATSAYSDGALPDGVAPVEITHDTAALEAYAESLPDGTPVEIGVQASDPDSLQVANIIAAQLQALNLDATVTEYQTSVIFGAFYDDRTSAPDLMVSIRTWPDSLNPYLYGHVFWDPDGGLNHLGCSDETATQKLADGLKSGSDADYAAAAEAITAAMCTPIWSFAKDFVVAQPWLGGVEEAHSVAEPYSLDFNALTIDE